MSESTSGPRLETANGQGNNEGHETREICLTLTVRDPEVVGELARRPDGPERTDYALAALRLGVLALRQASGMLDSQMVHHEGERLISGIRETLTERSTELLNNLKQTVQAYFDPETGLLQQRLGQLVKKDGELEKLLSQHLSGDTSTIALTLARHIGDQSPIFRLLSPQQSDGILAALTKTIEEALASQRQKIVGEFSLDQEDSALARLVREVTDKNGKLKEDLAKDLDKVFKEFSLDNENGALSRLVGRVEKAQNTIADQFSLDNADSALSRISRLLDTTNKSIGDNLSLDDETSPLSRLRRELLKVIEDLTKSNTTFQTEVRETLAALNARRQEADRSTRHGGEFEDEVGRFLQSEAQRLNDHFEAVGETVGRKPRCKVGDHIVTLGQESAASGAVIVCEAKEQQGYKMQDALAEIEEARDNRDAQVGIFVFSKKTAPDNIEPLQRHGNDLFVVWDREDVNTDVYLKAALSIARALVVRKRLADSKTQAELSQLDEAITKIAAEAKRAEQIVTWAQTVKNNGDKIITEAQKIYDNLAEETERLRVCLQGLSPAVDEAAA